MPKLAVDPVKMGDFSPIATTEAKRFTTEDTEDTEKRREEKIFSHG